MYSIVNRKYKNKNKIIDKEEIKNIRGYLMPTKNNKFIIEGEKITNIIIVNKKLAHPLVVRAVSKKYAKLITLLTELLISDDDSGDAYREALNQIERFRIQIKNKYREYLRQKELELMSKQLMTLAKEAKKRLIEIEDSFIFEMESSKNR